jgi:hypothetical protein
LFERDILLCAFCLDLVAEKQEKFFVHLVKLLRI